MVDVLAVDAREGNDAGMAVSRVLPLLNAEIVIDYETKGIESRVRAALNSLLESEIVTYTEVEASKGTAKLWRLK